MDTGRADLNAMLKVSSIRSDEPVFILRAQDPAAARAVRDWAAHARILGVPPAVLESALQQADRMAAFEPKKTPGDDHLTDAERRHLEYQLKRRDWSAGEGNPARVAELRDYAAEDPQLLLLQLAREHRELARVAAFAANQIDDSVPDKGDARRVSYAMAHTDAARESAARAAFHLTAANAIEAAARAAAPAKPVEAADA